jgi:biopolymer transport protein ExbB/TolQ
VIALASIGDSLGDALAQIATVLRVPVLVAAILILIAGAFEVGRYCAEVWRRWRRGREMELSQLVRHAVADPKHVAHYAYYAPSAFAEQALIGIVVAVTTGRPAEMEQALVAYELAVQRRLDRTRILVRAGPAIGLMGTLIPLAPGLAALGGGDVSALAGDLRDALAATVIGLLVGTVAFTLTLTRTRMYTEDLAALERAAEALRQDAFPAISAAPAPTAGAMG